MKIIKEGNKSILSKIKRFECHDCGCVFEADKNEYQCGEQYNQEYYYCVCPYCKHTTYNEVKIR